MMAKQCAAKTAKPAAKRRKAPEKRDEVHVRYNDEVRRIAGEES